MTTKTLTGNYPSGYAIAAAITNLYVNTGVNVSGNGLTDATTYVTIFNSGTVGGNGISLKAGGIVYNGAGSFPARTIHGAGAGVYMAAAGSVVNYGTISNGGPQYTAEGAVTFGDGGTVRNGGADYTTALLIGSAGVLVSAGNGTVLNYGTIIATNSFCIGVEFYGGGAITNGTVNDDTALIRGSRGVITGEGCTVKNFGSILATDSDGAGVGIDNGGLLINGTAIDTGALVRGAYGVHFYNAAATVLNFGTIEGTAQYGFFGPPGGDGVHLGEGGSATNGSAGDRTALIEGYNNGVAAAGAYATVSNFGTISGVTGAGVAVGSGGSITNGGSADRTALIEGVTYGVVASGAFSAVANFGTILAGGYELGDYGVNISGAGSLKNGSATNSTALIEGYGGVRSGAIAENFGTILALGDTAGAGVDLTGGAFVNGASTGSKALIEGYTGVTSGSATVTLINFGTIDGEGGRAVVFGSSLDDLVVEAGSTFVGQVLGDGGTLELGTGTGTLTGLLTAGNVTVSGSMATTTFTNFGTVQVDAPASFTLAGGGVVSSGQTFVDNGTVTTSGTLTVGGALTTAGTLAGTGALSISNGTAAFNGGTSLTIAKITEAGPATATVGTNMTYAGTWLQTSGTVSVNAGDKLTLTGSGDSFAGTLAGAGTIAFTGGSVTLSKTSLTAASVFIGAATVTLSGAISNKSAISVTSPSVIVAAAGATLYSGGTVTLSNNATNEITGASAAATLTNLNNKIYGAGQLGGGKMTLVNQAGGTIDGNQATGLTIDTGAATITNAGLIESAGSGLLTIKSAVANTGTLYASGGTLIANGAVTGTGKVTIANGLADFVSTFTENVAFTATSTGTLELSKSATYTGSISGFSKTGANFLDLADIGFTAGTTKATYSGTTTSGVLTVTDGTHTAKINLTGNYTTSTFVLATDGHGGTLIHDPAKAPATPAPAPKSPPFWTGPAPIVPFIGAMAGFGASSATASVVGASLHVKPLALASPHAARA